MRVDVIDFHIERDTFDIEFMYEGTKFCFTFGKKGKDWLVYYSWLYSKDDGFWVHYPFDDVTEIKLFEYFKECKKTRLLFLVH
jgi:hypothetical protein